MPKHKSIGGRKSVRIRKVLPKKAKPIYDSDENIPDEASECYHKDDIDIYNEQLEKDSDDEYAEAGVPEAKAPQKEAVYDFSDSDDEEEMEKRLRKIEANVRRSQKSESSDDENEHTEEEVGGRAKAWGKKRDDFYGADVTSKVDVGVSSDDDEAEAKLEEVEARLLQQKLMAQIDESDYGLDMFSKPDASSLDAAEKTSAPISASATEQVTADISSMSSKEKLRLLNKEYPEFINIVTDYKSHLTEYRDKLLPILDLHKRELIPDSSGVKLMRWKTRLILDYCSCCQFYLLLRAEKSHVEGHPVVKRMVQFKKLIQEIAKAEEKIKPQIDFLLKMVTEGTEDEIMIQPSQAEPVKSVKKLASKKVEKTVKTAKVVIVKPRKADKPKKSMQSLLDDEDEEKIDDDETLTGGEKEALELYSVMKERRLAGHNQDGEFEDDVDEEKSVATTAWEGNYTDEDGEKRAITEEMQKNRGLTAKRPKGLKNPRIKNKLKYQKKKKIHKSIVPQILRETNRYSGEASGIRAGRIRSVALS